MPVLKIITNVARAKLPENILQDTSVMFEKVIGRPLQTINVCILPDQLVAFGNTTEPCGYVELLSGGLGVEENKTISAAISKFIKEKLGIEPTRFIIYFIDAVPSHVGYNGTTVHELQSKAKK